MRRFFNGGIVSQEIIESADLRGKTVVVTGALKGGLGFETAKVLYELGAHVVLAVLDEKKGNESMSEIVRKNLIGSGSLDVMVVDLSDLASVKKFTENFKAKYDKIDILLNNAGVMLTPHGVTKQGVEIQFGINHLGHFLLTHELLDLVMNANGRIVNLSSICGEFIKWKDPTTNFSINSVTGPCNFSPSIHLYNRSKFACAINAKCLDRFLLKENDQSFAVSVHPGVIETNLFTHRTVMKYVFHFGNMFLKKPFYGAQTSLYAALAPKDKLLRSEYHADCKPKLIDLKLRNSSELQDRLWETSLKLCENYLAVQRKLPNAIKNKL
ncbi:predicted protein [Naegleria gruberi]|uniref:Predicted protein n=1 Tax=Naegleria gruberi TaxID=5762 RepID=D2VDN9_NAEGR|nr:uncharacterized protein NAEGRDRAFT_33289 [Naegleria gruberi]EFC44931.1 predicted protein [Naegleria gruberi]|eukprot:XP_002677675.1 predicted protein [Naegleria gruberi strain NEG-M]